MANVLVDTKKIQEAGNDIIRLTEELNEAINTLYSRISSVNSYSGGWTGTSAEEFIRKSNIEKKQYVELKNQLFNCGKFLLNTADRYETTVRNNKI